MYDSYDFTFAGVSASMYGMYISDIGGNKHSAVPFGNRAKIVETRLAQRVTPLHFGVRYNDDPLEFTLIFGADRVLDRWEMQEVSRWLTGYQEYQWLSIDQPDLDYVQFRCLITELTPIHNVWLPMAFEAKIRCDCPYAYGYPFSEVYTVSGERELLWRNDSSANVLFYPKLQITTAGSSFSVANRTTNDEAMVLSGLPVGIVIHADCENEVLTDVNGVYNLYNSFNFHFLSLQPGDNLLVFNGHFTVTISGRYLYNVGG